MAKHHLIMKSLTRFTGLALALAIITACSNVGPSEYSGRVARETNRKYAGKFRGQYMFAFDSNGRLLRQGYPTWYLQAPEPGTKTPLSKIPPTVLSIGASQNDVERSQGTPDFRSRHWWGYEVR